MYENIFTKLMVCQQCEVSWRVEPHELTRIPCFNCEEFSGEPSEFSWKEDIMKYNILRKNRGQ